MKHFVSVIFKNQLTESRRDIVLDSMINTAKIGLIKGNANYEIFESENNTSVLRLPLKHSVPEKLQQKFVEALANQLFDNGHRNFEIELSVIDEKDIHEETYDGDEFYEAYGDLWFNEDEEIDEAEYQGRKVKLGKPMRGDVKKFKVYVKNPKGNVVKVNFGDPDMKIKKSNPARRKSFRARHNCDNPGPRHKARFWSCRAW
jgi:hypothetical protein